MFWLFIFLCVMFFGLGYFTREVVDGIKFLNEMVERHKREDKEFAERFAKSVQEVTETVLKPLAKDLDSLKNSVKKKH